MHTATIGVTEKEDREEGIHEQDIFHRVILFLPANWLQVFKRVHSALLGSGGGPEQRMSLVPSEKCVVGWGSDNDEMRMITASFARAIERFAGDLCLHFLPLFQQVVAIRKTCNQLPGRRVTLGQADTGAESHGLSCPSQTA